MEPSKEAVERAREILGGCMFGEQALRSVAIYVDEVNYFSRKAIQHLEHHDNCSSPSPNPDGICECGLYQAMAMLEKVMLPDEEPDPLAEAMRAAGFGVGNEYGRMDRLHEALTAAGYKIVKAD